MNIYLIGYRCTGKTSVGRLLASRLQWAFVDTDSRLAEKAGMTVSQIVTAYGWEGFRNREERVMAGLENLEGTVVATGGGVVLDPENVRRMKRGSNVVVWLKASPETIKARMLADKTTVELRPSLTGRGLDAEIRKTLSERGPLYRSAAHFAVDTDQRGITETCEFITAKLENDYAGKFVRPSV